MDKVYRFDPAKITEKYNIKEYFNEYSKLIDQLEHDEVITDENKSKKLDEIYNFRIKNINYFDEENDESNDAENNTTNQYEYNLGLPQGLPNIPAIQKLKLLTEKYAKEEKKKSLFKQPIYVPINNTEIIEGEKSIPGKDILIEIRIFNPFVADSRHGPPSKRKISLSRVISILGCQTLADLRDKISCISDLSVSYESSNDPSAAQHLLSNKNLYKSGFFYIENTFYNDMRDKNNHDNSAVIREWAEAKNFGQFSVEKMEETKIESLNVRFGYPWVYQHQGTCEHLVVFADARLINPDDHLAIKNYPRVDRISCIRNSSCLLCADKPVYWITIDSDRVPHNPCYFCKKCFKSFNYIDGKKIGNFKAYRFPCDPDIIEAIENKSRVKIELMDQS
ncbi:snRNA-activating protein complex subunit 3-like [Aphidius gifuensis]|uniref:snRNA-activating protein complex subunit 3-like n=1 Tax=Aphidius gifuensis TaxID=684658 RepID=UPI001CDC2384|nr:snRNA-activating protein complex subunit 3-like [Aphidius gifuensis]